MGSHTPSSEALSPFLEGGILSCKEPIKAEDSPHITFESSLGVFASVSGCSESESKYTCKV